MVSVVVFVVVVVVVVVIIVAVACILKNVSQEYRYLFKVIVIKNLLK